MASKFLQSIPKTVRKPVFARNNIESGIVHVSVGGFHRSHQAVYTQLALEKYGGNWAITGVGAFEGDRQLCEDLKKQDCLYTLLERSGDSISPSVIGSIKDIIHAPGNYEAVIAEMAAKKTNIISLTVTEKGYYSLPDGTLDIAHPDIIADLNSPERPKTALGMILEALSRRQKRGGAPPTVMSCDNVPGNGKVVSSALSQLAAARSDSLASWIESHVTFPSGMVDRITPVPTKQDVEDVSRLFGYHDACPVSCEPFMQWVLEDSFVSGRPRWEDVGVRLTTDVAPYEHAKIRLLNAGHSVLSLPAYASGLQLVSEAATHTVFAPFLRGFMDDVTPTLHPLPGVDLEDYKDTLVSRFANTAVKDPLSRICTDTSSKISVQLVPIVEDLLRLTAQGQPQCLSRCAMMVASWLLHLTGVDEKGGSMIITDNMQTTLQPLALQILAGSESAHTLLQHPLFGGLHTRPEFAHQVAIAVEEVRAYGVTKAISRLENSQSPLMQ